MLERVAPLIQAADLAICHMEVPISADNRDLGGYPLFSAPAESASSMVAAGYDGCSTASNHSLDRGFGGVSSTLDVFDRAGLVHAGTGRSEQESLAPGWYEVEGLRIAHLSYTYGTNGIPLPADAPWSVRLIDAPAVVADASRARGEGADVVVVSLHWGNEYQSAPTDAQRGAADAVTRDGAVDLVVGHHAHVPQPAEQVNGRWVLFGLGNFLSNQSASCCSAASQDGVLATADLVVRETAEATTTEVERIGFAPIRVDRAAGYRVTPVAEALAGATPTSMGRDELTASLQRTVEVFAASPHPQLALLEPPG
jgi:poly-gamma-glutamate synthesis protein (capsule biosynthesis protein)